MRGTWRRRLGAWLVCLTLLVGLLPTAALAADNSNPASVIPAESSVTYGTSLSFHINVDGLTYDSTGNASFYLDSNETAFYTVDIYTFPCILPITIQGDGWTAEQHTVKAVITSSGQSYECTCNLTVTKANQNLSDPTASSKTSTSVTLNAVTGGQTEVKYACVQGNNATAPADDSDEWKDSTEFTGLQPATAYTFFARCAENDYYNEATSSAVIYTNYGAPGGLDFIGGSSGEALAMWLPVSGATSYTVALYKEGADKPLFEGPTDGGNNEYTMQYTFSIESAGTYYFTVKATSNEVDGDAATSKTATFYQVTFDSNGGSEVTPQYVDDIVTLDEPTSTKEGYSLDGWYQTEDFTGEAWDFSCEVEGDMTLYAKWLYKAGVERVTVNGQAATAGENNTFTVSLPYGSSLPAAEVVVTPVADAQVTSGPATSDGGRTWTFTVTSEDGTTRAEYTVNVSITPDPAAGNRADVSAARAAIGNALWTVPQATANTPEAVEAWIEGRLAAMDLRGVKYDVTVTNITPAAAGAAADRDGTNGSFGFTVSLSKGSGSAYAGGSASVTGGVITATPYNKWTVTVAAGTGGTVSGGGTYEEGSTVTVTAAPSGSRYYFLRWTENGAEVSTDASYAFTLTADRTLTAEFGRRSSGGSSSNVPEPEGPSTGDSDGWRDIQDEVAGADPGDTIIIDMGDETEVPAQVFEEVAGRDVTVEIDLGGGVSWSVNGQDVPQGANLSNLNLSVSMDTTGIPENVFNAVTGEHGSTQFTLAHDGEFGFALTLSAPLGRENAGYWANLYYYNERSRELEFVTSARIGADGSAALRLTHASQYAVVIDGKSHQPAQSEPLPFTDVPAGHWAETAIRYVWENGLMTGVSETIFDPDGVLTRGQTVTILWRMAGSSQVNYLMDFSDVDPADWYGEAVRWASALRIAGGYGDGRFGPDDPITREQLAVMLYQYAWNMGYDLSIGEDTNILSYADAFDVSEYAVSALQWACGAGVISGTGDGSTLSPQGQATRAQAAVMLERFCELGK